MKTWENIKSNPSLKTQYLLRETVIDVIRKFFKNKNFNEVFTPILVPTPSCEPTLEVFQTELRTIRGEKRKGFLIMSPEYSLKKLIAAGFKNIFEVTRSFRNEEEVSESHNPEFTILEWYRAGSDYRQIMQDFEQLFTEIVLATGKTNNLAKWVYQSSNYDLTLPWKRLSVAEAFERYCGINEDTLLDKTKLIIAARQKGYKVDDSTAWEQVFYQLFFNDIEPKLKTEGRPVFIYDYPVSEASLARKKQSDPRWAERFEVYLAGLELGNCFSELTDADEQRKRFETDLIARKNNNKTEYGIDEDLLKALGAEMPETAGIAVGVDRLLMLAGDLPAISDTLLFPGAELFDL